MKKSASIALIVLLAAVLSGCASEQYGAGIDKNIPAVKVKDIYLDSGVIGKRVTLQGTISSQCGSNGCWFVLQDDTGQVFVNLAPNNMTLPPRMNKTAKVTGVVYPVEGQLQVIAQGVEVK
ncbi:MAG: DNA-binding protein [Nitrospirota bacterium]|nr:DNA-binding protein [Nitrospirota bacterium]